MTTAVSNTANKAAALQAVLTSVLKQPGQITAEEKTVGAFGLGITKATLGVGNSTEVAQRCAAGREIIELSYGHEDYKPLYDEFLDYIKSTYKNADNRTEHTPSKKPADYTKWQREEPVFRPKDSSPKNHYIDVSNFAMDGANIKGINYDGFIKHLAEKEHLAEKVLEVLSESVASKVKKQRSAPAPNSKSIAEAAAAVALQREERLKTTTPQPAATSSITEEPPQPEVPSAILPEKQANTEKVQSFISLLNKHFGLHLNVSESKGALRIRTNRDRMRLDDETPAIRPGSILESVHAEPYVKTADHIEAAQPYLALIDTFVNYGNDINLHRFEFDSPDASHRSAYQQTLAQYRQKGHSEIIIPVDKIAPLNLEILDGLLGDYVDVARKDTKTLSRATKMTTPPTAKGVSWSDESSLPLEDTIPRKAYAPQATQAIASTHSVSVQTDKEAANTASTLIDDHSNGVHVSGDVHVNLNNTMSWADRIRGEQQGVAPQQPQPAPEAHAASTTTTTTTHTPKNSTMLANAGAQEKLFRSEVEVTREQEEQAAKSKFEKAQKNELAAKADKNQWEGGVNYPRAAFIGIAIGFVIGIATFGVGGFIAAAAANALVAGTGTAIFTASGTLAGIAGAIGVGVGVSTAAYNINNDYTHQKDSEKAYNNAKNELSTASKEFEHAKENRKTHHVELAVQNKMTDWRQEHKESFADKETDKKAQAATQQKGAA